MRERIDYEHRYRQLVERLPAIVYRASVLDSGDWHYVSPAIERVLGWTFEEWQAHPAPWGTSVHPDDLAAAVEQEQRAVETGSLVSEYRLRHKNGSDVWIRDEAVLIEEGWRAAVARHPDGRHRTAHARGAAAPVPEDRGRGTASRRHRP